MKHGDEKQTFETGAQRDTTKGKLRYDLISPLALQRLAIIYTKGAEHYGDRNWEKGMPFSRCMASLQRHLFQFLQGDTSEDHLAQMVWNGVTLLHYQEAIGLGLLPDELDDLPDYRPYLQQEAENPDTTEQFHSRVCPNISDGRSDSEVVETNLKQIAADKHFQDLWAKAFPPGVQEIPFGAELIMDESGGIMGFVKPEPKDSFHDMECACLRRATQLELEELGCPRSVARSIAGGVSYPINQNGTWVYIAGPMRGYEKFNFPTFDATRDDMLARHYNVISPADIDRATEKDAEDPSKVDVTDQTRFALRDFWSLYFIRKQGDQNAIMLLPGWCHSTGASAEFHIAKWLGLKVLSCLGRPYPEAQHDYALANATVK